MKSRKSPVAFALVAACLVLVAPFVARAHGGEDHGAPAAAASTATEPAVGVAGDTFEVLIKHRPAVPGQPLPMRVFVADATTNAPVEGADVELSFATQPPQTVKVERTATPGHYRAQITAPALGSYEVTASVSKADAVDLLVLGNLVVAPPDADHDHDVAPTGTGWSTMRLLALGAGAGAAVLLLALVGVRGLRGRRRPGPPGPGLPALLLVAGAATTLSGGVHRAAPWLGPPDAHAHGGEDHGAPATATGARGPGGAIHFPKEAQFLLGVRTQRVGTHAMQARLEVPGKIVPRTDRHAQIVAPVAGRVLARGARLPLVGEKVKKGQVLAVIEQSLAAPEAAQLLSERIRAEGSSAQARAHLEQARRDLQRVRSLEGVVASKDIQQAETAVKLAEEDAARLDRERALYAGAAASGRGGALTRFALTSPIDGVVVEVVPTVGEQVDPSRPLFTIMDARVVWAEASVYSGDVARVEAARQALVRVDAYPDVSFAAQLFHLGQVVDEATRTVKVVFEAKNPDGRLRPGMFATVAIGAGGTREVLAVPEAALVESGGRKLVYIKTGPETFMAHDVATGGRDGDMVEVHRGLEAGDRVVTGGLYQIRSAEGGR